MHNRNFNKRLFQKLFSIILLAGVLANAFSAAAQTRRTSSGTVASKQSKTTAQKCSGAWTGTITYTRTQKIKDSSTTPRVSGRGTSRRETETNYNYSSRIIVAESAARDGSNFGKGRIEYAFSTIDKNISEEQNSCDRGKTWRTMRGESTTRIEASASSPGAVDANVRVGVNADGTYSVSGTLPPVEGKTSARQTSEYSNQCVAKEGKNIQSPETALTVEGQSFTTDGSHRVDPKNPNRLTGSYTLKYTQTLEETVSWDLEKCGAALRVTDLKFYQAVYPSPDNWIEIGKGKSNFTVDGNEVKVVAKITNFSGENKRGAVIFKELNADMDLPGGKRDADFAPGEEREIEYRWDTSGFSWKESLPFNFSDLSRRIEASVETDKRVGAIEVLHKPVVIVPGVWSPKERIGELETFFRDRDWRTRVVVLKADKKAPENASAIKETVREIQETTNAWQVDLVAHSNGGLAARAYVSDLMPVAYNNRPIVAHLVMLGTPNLGTPCASGVESIYSKIFYRQPDSFTEMSIRNMAEFNKVVRNRKGTKFYAVAGGGFERTCQHNGSGDSVVPYASAIYKSKKYAQFDVPHNELVNDKQVEAQIWKWLAVLPSGDHAPDYTQALNELSLPENDRAAATALETFDFGKTRRYGAMFQNAVADLSALSDEPEPNFATGVKLKPNQSIEIEIPVTKGATFSLVLYTSPDVSATLFNERGETLGASLAGSPQAGGIFRTISVEKPFEAGKWKLKLASRAGADTETVLAAYIDYASALFRGDDPK